MNRLTRLSPVDKQCMDRAQYATPVPGATLSAPGKDLTFLPVTLGRLRFREDVGHDAAPVPEHLHLWQTERFTVLEGDLVLTVDGVTERLGAGESRDVPPRTRHTYAPGLSDGVPCAALIEVEIWPALRAEHFFETIYGLAREGRLPPRGIVDHIGLMALCHAHGFILTGPPTVFMRAMAALSSAVAAVLHIDPWAPRFAARPPRLGLDPILYMPSSEGDLS